MMNIVDYAKKKRKQYAYPVILEQPFNLTFFFATEIQPLIISVVNFL